MTVGAGVDVSKDAWCESCETSDNNEADGSRVDVQLWLFWWGGMEVLDRLGVSVIRVEVQRIAENNIVAECAGANRFFNSARYSGVRAIYYKTYGSMWGGLASPEAALQSRRAER